MYCSRHRNQSSHWIKKQAVALNCESWDLILRLPSTRLISSDEVLLIHFPSGQGDWWFPFETWHEPRIRGIAYFSYQQTPKPMSGKDLASSNNPCHSTFGAEPSKRSWHSQASFLRFVLHHGPCGSYSRQRQLNDTFVPIRGEAGLIVFFLHL